MLLERKGLRLLDKIIYKFLPVISLAFSHYYYFPFLINSGRIFGLVYSPWERVKTSYHGSQVSLFPLLTGTVFFFVSLLSPAMLFSG